MNIKDSEKLKEEESNLGPLLTGDKLDQIFAGQKFLMKRYKDIAEAHFEKVFGTKIEIDPKSWEGGEHNLHTKTGNFLVKDMLDCTIHELSEAVQVLKSWKAWKQTEIPADVDHFREELIDALHFYIEACILSGITSQDLYEIYFKKNKVNQFRQRTNY